LNAIIKIPLFSFESRDVRILQIDGDPWFVGVDVCEALGLSNPTEALKRLDDDELTSVQLRSGGQGREMNIISEPGLYALITSSKKDEVKRFKRWVNHEVLPQIRKTGRYYLIRHPQASQAAPWLAFSSYPRLPYPRNRHKGNYAWTA
jgi:prophage antirepressor-like protein